MVNILINNKHLIATNCIKYEQICALIEKTMHLQHSEYYLLSNGKRLTATCDKTVLKDIDVHCVLRQNGGKGGFGSMLRAIGAQIEKTTNREACRDLSGRRLRDINEEKRVRSWLEKQDEREREAEERKKRKIEKLLAKPKHEFKDEQYEKARAKLTEKVNDAFEEGLKQAEEAKQNTKKPDSPPLCSSSNGPKRKSAVTQKTSVVKKKRKGLWLGDDLSGSDSDDSCDGSEAVVLKT